MNLLKNANDTDQQKNLESNQVEEYALSEFKYYKPTVIRL